ncbi:MAG TPA: hypothetical protein PKE40_12215 [Arachnia sp.]|nr:hypothetical protein [Arachnia sp.]HMT87110.1 hypothetical protein [Arachnia sp.]
MRAIPHRTRIDATAWQREQTADGVRFTHPNPDGNRFWDHHGFWETNDHAVDVLGWYGVRLRAAVDAPMPVTLTLTCSLVRSPRPEALPQVSARAVLLPGEETYVPFAQFDVPDAMGVLLKGVVAVAVLPDAGAAAVEVEELEFVAARDLLVACDVRGAALDAADPESRVAYDIELLNMLDVPQAVSAAVRRRGNECLPAELSLDEQRVQSVAAVLAPHERRRIQLVVASSDRLAPLGHERQRVVVSSASGFRSELAFLTVNNDDDFRTTLRRADIAEISATIAEHDWACAAFARRYAQAEAWVVPSVDPQADHLFATRQSDEAFNSSLVALISGEPRFAEKTARFLREMVHPERGYFRTLKGGNQELVHEGEFFASVSMAYDHIRDLGLLTGDEVERLHRSFRTFMAIAEREMLKGKVSNWQLCELQGAISCAAVLQDLERIDHFLDADGGVLDHLARGVLDDGWWFEASIGYNLLAMGIYLQLITCVDKWGFNLRDAQVPASYGRDSSLDDAVLPASDRIDGLSTEIWGPVTRNTRSVKLLADSLTPFFGHDGVIFGMNDAVETRAPAYHLLAPRYDLAYRVYRNPAYLPLLHSVSERDVYYGVPELPPADPSSLEASRSSVSADVAGIAVLRSRTPGRAPGEQYQVSVKSGILGGAHGHYDRLALNSIRRHGKSFYNPENVWYSYHTFMYKFYVQNSITHNMATVDLKQQDPAQTTTLAFHSGERMQYLVQEITTAWCHPPYGGWVVTPGLGFAEQAAEEGRTVALLPAGEEPPYSTRSGFTEPILQRRATVVTDDYVLLVDYLEGEAEHQYDCLLHASGLRALVGDGEATLTHLSADPSDSDGFGFTEGPALVYQGWQPTLDPSPLGSGQFITDCHAFQARGVLKASFVVDMSSFGAGRWLTQLRTDHNAPGPLHLDIYSVAPAERTVVVGCEPEYFQTQQTLAYAVCAGGESTPLAEGGFGAWIFGRDDLDIALPEGAEELTLQTRSTATSIKTENEAFPPVPALFWGDGVIACGDGTAWRLRDLPHALENTVDVPIPDRDYAGGPVKLEMRRMTSSIPATPADASAPARVRVDLRSLAGRGPLRLTVSVGADYPIGDERARRRTLDVRTHGRTASFLTLIEHHEGAPMVREVREEDGVVTVRLADGRTQRLTITDLTLADASILLEE